jgi:hypothetical protein
MDTSTSAAPIPANSDAWRALPSGIRQTVQDEARRGRPAPDVATAAAAVGAGRVAARWTIAGAALSMTMLALVAVGCPVVNQGLPAPDRLSKNMTLAVVALPGLLLGLGGVAIMLWSGRSYRLVGPNLALAATQVPGTPRSDVRFGFRWPRAMAVLGVVAYLAVATLGVFYFHSVLALVFGIATIVLTWAAGPSAGPTKTARINAAGIDLPKWGARLSWTSVGAVTIVAKGQLSIEVGGPYERTGWLPAQWTKRIAATLRPGRCVTIASRHAELGLWAAQHHLDSTRTAAVDI